MQVQLTDFGFLTDASGKLVTTDRGDKIPVATDAFTGDRYQRIHAQTPGTSNLKRQAATEKLRQAGAVYLLENSSKFRGWWAKLPAIVPNAQPVLEK